MAHFLFVFSSLLFFAAPTWSQQEHTSNFFPIKESAKAPATSSKYTCKIDNECLNNLHNILLNKESERSIYQYCEAFYQNSRQCCISPSECNEDFGRETAQLLRQKSLSLAQDAGPSCQSSPKLSSFLWQAQSLMCQKGVSHCRQKCKDKLGELKRTFKQCFLIPASYSIDTILDRARTPSSHPHCWQEMRDVAKKYKEQSRNSQAVFKEYLKVRDIVDCESIIKQLVSRQNSNHFAFNICNQVQAQKQEPAKPEERKEPIRKQETKEPTKPMGHWPAYDAEEWEEQQEKIRQSHAAVFGYRIEKTQEPESSLSPEHNKEIQSEKWGVVKEEKYGIVKDEPSLETGLDMSPGSLVREVPDKPEEDNKSLSDTLSKPDKDISKNDKEENKDKSSQAGKTPKKPADKALAKIPKQKSSVSKSRKNSAASKSSLSQRPTKQKNPSVFVNKDRTQKTDSQVNKAKAKKNRSKRRKADSRTKQSKDLKKKQASKQDPSHASLAGSELKPSSNSKPLQVAQVSNRSGRCPVSMPKIRSAIVFQSVEAPQIEPMNRQAHLPYNNYDLVMGKPAGILIHLDGTGMNSRHEFAIDLSIVGYKGYISKCFHTVFSGEMIKGQEDFCSFTMSNLRKEGYHKFFPLPMKGASLNREGLTLSVKLTLYPRDYENDKKCHQKKNFQIKIIKTHNLKLGFTRIDGGRNCYERYDSRKGIYDLNSGYDPVSYNKVNDFVNSDEVQFYIESMFPVRGVFSEVVRYSWKGRSYDYIEGYCDSRPALDSPAKKDTMGLLADVDELEKTRADLSYDKIVAIVPESYFFFHGQLTKKVKVPAGMIIRPRIKKSKYEDWWIRPFELPEIAGGSWNVIFVRSDEVDDGTVSHELAHSLGQGRELYEGYELCRHFRRDKLKSCHKNLFIPRFLHTGIRKNRPFWHLIKKDRYTVMDNQGDIKQQWIDRDTYQKNLWTLSKYDPVIPPEVNLYKKTSSLRARKRKIIVSGFYNKKQNTFIVSKTRISLTKILTPSFVEKAKNNLPFITFQLKEKNMILQEIKRPVFEMEIELLYKNEFSTSRPFDFSHAVAVFKLPESYKQRNLRVFVLDPKGGIIYSAPVPKKIRKGKEKGNIGNIARIDKIQ